MHLAASSTATSTNADQGLLDPIWDLLDRDVPLPDLVEDWPGINAVALQTQLVPTHDPSAGPMPLGFAYFLTKDPCPYRIANRVHRATKYMNESNLTKF